MTTFDRYLLGRYFHVVAVFLVATIGLFAVVDGFTNLDAFQQATANQGSLMLFLRMGEHYAFQSAYIVDLAGPTIMVIATMCALALMLKSGEIHPVLAAGVPTYRLTLPLAFGVLIINGLLILNQEWVLPQVAPRLQGTHGSTGKEFRNVQPQRDPEWNIFVAAAGALPAEGRLEGPEFRLPLTLSRDLVTIRADSAHYLPAKGELPSGWLAQDVSPPIAQLPLTEAGRQAIVPQENGKDLFIASTLTMDQLNRQSSGNQMLSTQEVLRRLQQPSGSMFSRRMLLVHFHNRLTKPVLTIIGLYIVIPLIVRRERMNAMQQVTNIATCAAALGMVFGLSMASQYLGSTGWLNPEQAVWAPLIAGGGLASWLSGVVRT